MDGRANSKWSNRLGLYSRSWKATKLPREIRDMIWREFLPQIQDKISAVPRTDSRNTELAVLRTSRRICCEVTCQIYPSGLHPFIISVTPEYEYESWVTLSNGKINPSIWKLKSFFGERKRGILNIGRKPAVYRVEIEAPDRDDAGQLICLLEKVNDVVDTLRLQVKYPRGVEIILKDGKKGKWFIDGKPTTTNIDSKPCLPDYQNILFPFAKLRNIDHSKVEFSKDTNIDRSHLDNLRRIQDTMKETIPFSEYVVGPWSDSSLQSDDDDNRFRFALAITQLDGWTAMMLRLQRFVDCYTSLGLDVNRYPGEPLVSQDLAEEMQRVLKQGQTQGEQYWSWIINNDVMIDRLEFEYLHFGRSTPRLPVRTTSGRIMWDMECRDEFLRTGSDLHHDASHVGVLLVISDCLVIYLLP